MRRTADDRRDALQRGAEAEAHVAGALEAAGWSILARNWRGGGGEIDIVAEKGGRVRLVEVKGRSDSELIPLEQIDATKQRRLRGAGRAWLQQHDVGEEICFLVAVVHYDEGWSIQWIDDAFDG